MGRNGIEGVKQARSTERCVRSLDGVLSRLVVSNYSIEKQKVITRLAKQAKRHLWAFRLIDRVTLGRHNFGLLKGIRPVHALYPTNSDLIEGTKDYLRKLNKKALKEFREDSPERTNIIVMIVGCSKYQKRLRKVVDKLREKHAEIGIVGLIGDENTADWKIKYDKKKGILKLPCSDGYEALTEKVVWGCLAIELAMDGMTVVKVDDDTKSINSQKLKKLKRIVQSKGAKAGGSPISVQTPLHIDRGWHLGKSNGEKNLQPFQGIGPKIWMSGGAGYLLMPETVKTISEFALHSWKFIQSQVYEDLTISWIVDSCCGQINWIEDFSTTGIKNERAQDIIGGKTYHNPKDLKEEERK